MLYLLAILSIFLENLTPSSPISLNPPEVINNLLIPYFATIMGFYYGFTRGKQLKEAFWSLGITQGQTINKE